MVYHFILIADEYILLEDSDNENYYGLKFMIMIIRLHRIRIYRCETGLSIPLKDSNKLLELNFKDIVKVCIVTTNQAKAKLV